MAKMVSTNTIINIIFSKVVKSKSDEAIIIDNSAIVSDIESLIKSQYPDMIVEVEEINFGEDNE